MSIVIMDLDNTVIYTDKLKDDIAKELGFPTRAAFDRSYKEHFTKGEHNYSIEKHLEFLGKNDDITRARIYKKIFNGFEKKYLLAGADELVMNLKNKFKNIIMMSLGDPDYQERKFESLLRLSPLFKRKYYVTKDKLKIMQELMDEYKDEKFIIINDDELEIRELEDLLKNRLEASYLIGNERDQARKIYTPEELNKELFPERKETDAEIKKAFSQANK